MTSPSLANFRLRIVGDAGSPATQTVDAKRAALTGGREAEGRMPH